MRYSFIWVIQLSPTLSTYPIEVLEILGVVNSSTITLLSGCSRGEKVSLLSASTLWFSVLTASNTKILELSTRPNTSTSSLFSLERFLEPNWQWLGNQNKRRLIEPVGLAPVEVLQWGFHTQIHCLWWGRRSGESMVFRHPLEFLWGLLLLWSHFVKPHPHRLSSKRKGAPLLKMWEPFLRYLQFNVLDWGLRPKNLLMLYSWRLGRCDIQCQTR